MLWEVLSLSTPGSNVGHGCDYFCYVAFDPSGIMLRVNILVRRAEPRQLNSQTTKKTMEMTQKVIHHGTS